MVKRIDTPRARFVLLILSLAALLLNACSSSSGTVPPDPVLEVPAAMGTAEAPALPAATETAVPSATATVENIPVATSAGPVTVQINADGSGDLATLLEAVAYVAAGSTIELSAGVFEAAQTLELDKPLTITGAGKDQTTIVSEAASAAVNLSVDGIVTLGDLTISHAGSSAADVISVRSGELDLANCRLKGGLRASGGANYGAGIFVLNDSIVRTTNCEFSDNAGVGVELLHEAQINMDNSVVSGNEAGILFDGSSSGQISGSIIEKNRDVGIYVFALANPHISANLIQDNAGFGIRYQLDDGVGGAVEGNELLNNNAGSGDPGADIVIFDTYTPQITGNTCSGETGRPLVSADGDAVDPSGIVFFYTDLGRPDNLVLEDNECAHAVCGLSAGASDFELQCVNP